MTFPSGDSFFGILESSKAINMYTRLEVWTCHEIYNRIKTMENWECWKPETDMERKLLLGFQAQCSNKLAETQALSIVIQDMYSLYHFSVNDREAGKTMWLEYSVHKFKDEFAYANQTRLEKLKIYEIRKLAAEEGVILPSGKTKAELIAEFGKQITGEDTAMAKKVSLEAVTEAVKTAETEEAVKEVLMNCTKAQMEEVFLAVMGLEDEKVSQSWKKEALCNYYSARIIAYKAREAFKKMTVNEKAEYLKSDKYSKAHCQLRPLLKFCSAYELLELVRILGIDFQGYKEVYKEKGYLYLETILRSLISHSLNMLGLRTRSESRYTQSQTAEVSYADVRNAYNKYDEAQASHKETPTDEGLKAVAHEAFDEYGRLLEKYAQSPSAEQEEVRNFLVGEFGGLFRPLDGVVYLSNKTLVEMSHKAGIHADRGMSRRDMAIRLLRWSGIGCETKTTEEHDLQRMEDLHERQDSLEAEIRDKRKELLGIAEALKAIKKGSRHYSGLLVLKARVEEEYRELRLESLYVRKELRRYAERLDELREMLNEIQAESCQHLLVAI